MSGVTMGYMIDCEGDRSFISNLPLRICSRFDNSFLFDRFCRLTARFEGEKLGETGLMVLVDDMPRQPRYSVKQFVMVDAEVGRPLSEYRRDLREICGKEFEVDSYFPQRIITIQAKPMGYGQGTGQ